MKFVLNSILTILLFNSCCQDNNKTPLVFKDQYIEGKVIIRAEKKHPIGLIKIKDIFDNDPYLESPSRAILYNYNAEGCNNEVDLDSSVRFEVYVENGIKFACIPSVQDSSKFITNADLYNVLDSFDVNLHNSDPHREGPQHKRRHTRPNTKYSAEDEYENDVLNYYVYFLSDPDDPVAAEKRYLIYTEEEFTANTDYFMYFYENVPDTIDNVTGIEDPNNVYILSKTHDHTH